MSSVCGCKEVYRFPHITYPYSALLFFAAASLLFVHLKKWFSFFINVTVHAKTLRKSAILISRYRSRRHERQFLLFFRFVAHKVRTPF